MTFAKLKAELERDEGRRLIAYKDSEGFFTIGIGHLLGESPRMARITNRECDALFVADVDDATAALRRVFALTPAWEAAEDVRMRALVNMAFNRGEGHMRESSTITPAIRAALAGSGTWAAVPVAIKASPWAKEIGERAVRLAKMFETGSDA